MKLLKKKSKLLPDARLGDLLTLCQITKYMYIYHLFFTANLKTSPITYFKFI